MANDPREQPTDDTEDEIIEGETSGSDDDEEYEPEDDEDSVDDEDEKNG